MPVMFASNCAPVMDAGLYAVHTLYPLPWRQTMFFFFSNKLGCLGSILVSLVVTLLLLLAFGWL